MEIEKYLTSLTYPGRTILAGKDENGSLFYAYAIMGRSEHSRNRIFKKEANKIKTVAFDESLLKDPHLIIYNAVIREDGQEIFTNGDQTDTIYQGLLDGKTFASSLESREYEDDAPAYTPRISGMFKDHVLSLSILRRKQENCERSSWTYENITPNTYYIIHTYEDDGTPLPSFQGDPRPLEIKGTMTAEKLCHLVFDSLHDDNKISVYAAQVGGEEYMINKKQGDK